MEGKERGGSPNPGELRDAVGSVLPPQGRSPAPSSRQAAGFRTRQASDDPEKTNTTYLDDSQPAQDITIKVEDPDCLSSSSYRDVESERFLSSSSSTARRVSFNEAALFDQGKKTQEKGRRYTLTEGFFSPPLKHPRLPPLPLPPPALKIVTIHECESSENSLAMTPRLPPPKPGLAIFQPPAGALPQPALPSHAVCPSSALPGALPDPEIQVIVEEAGEVAPEPKAGSEPPGDDDCPGPGRCLGLGSGLELMDKIAGGLEERLYGHLRKAGESPEHTVAVAASDAPPDHSPV
ncbi:voltage-dependent calcium channel beta subunit-associated regulatory protein [Egretta garzetta]|uniref:voltage-dependent calcium channel beta subunit-associated regulatory protein n=1 Tax=Egretta garzetta TaxID=188379 RepID=UPI00163C4471|nr:voltage-dependent calcium channel beta subunit-associated regulatory protein [Egretta garzetta]